MKSDRLKNSHSLAEEIQSIIKGRILRGEYTIGQRIKESHVAQELKVSRTPVREALKRLGGEGLVDSVPNRGFFALGFTKQDIDDLYAVRAAVEVVASKRAALLISSDEIKKLQDAFDRMEFYSRKKDSRKIMELNEVFHEIIYNASKSRFLAQIYNSYQDYVQKARKATIYCRDNLDDILYEHREILLAVESKDAAAAGKSVKNHLNNSRIRAEKSLNL